MAHLKQGEVPRKEFSDAEKVEMERLRRTGKTPKELAEKYRTQVFRVHKVLREQKHLQQCAVIRERNAKQRAERETNEICKALLAINITDDK